jgi:hypothetical protein
VESAVVPDAIEPVVGWRVWRVRDTGRAFELTSANRPTAWAPGEIFAASCDRDAAHPTPALDCTCGIYASRQPATAVELLPPYIRAVSSIIAPSILGYDTVMAVGLVALWGEIVVCDWGWRAQYAYPRELFVPSSVKHYRRDAGSVEIFDSSGLAEILGGTYGVPARVAWNLRPLPLLELARRAA